MKRKEVVDFLNFGRLNKKTDCIFKTVPQHKIIGNIYLHMASDMSRKIFIVIIFLLGLFIYF